MSERIPFLFAAISLAALDAAEEAGVSAAAQAAYVHICRHHSSGVTTIGLTRLARKLNCSEDAAGHYVQELKDADLIRVEVRPGRCNRYCIVAWHESTPRKSRDVLEPSRSLPEDLPPSGGDPIQVQEGSDPEGQPGVLKRLEKTAGRWKARAIERVEGFLKKRTEQEPSKPPSKPPAKSTPEPVEQSGGAAPPLRAGSPPAREEQPKAEVVDLVPGQKLVSAEQLEAERMTLGTPAWELDGREAPSAEETKAFVLRTLIKGLSPAPDGCWYRNGVVVTTEQVIAGPIARANGITAEDVERQRHKAPVSLRIRCSG